ncbi:MAG: carboxypeptidase-like regulatory domain-containing protein, partial [Prevotella sp.]|nr:carboxypeptidase-like regulatory domain-containing protein [Prevotella sp.]
MREKVKILLVMLFLCVGTAMAQVKVTGSVTSQDDGQPVIGASVIVQGSKTGTVTDVDGHFSLEVPENSKLVFSYVGMETQTLTAKPK